jgi:hypothetical protein
MMEIPVLDFDLAVERTEDGYFVRVLASPVGEAVAPFAAPLLAREVDQLWRLLLAPPAEGLQGAQQQSAIRQIGERLFRSLMTDHIHLCWEESQRLAYGQRARLRLRLHLQGVPEFADLPWEYLYDPQRKEFVALMPQTPLLRYADLKHHITPFRTPSPLRLLVVVANPGGRPLYDEEESWLSLLDTLDHLAAVGKLILERLFPPTVHELQRRLRQRQYHLLHFIGHGAYDGLAQDHLLLFEDEMGRARPVNSQHFGALLRDHYSMRLATVQACPTAEEQRINPFSGVANQLLRRGLPAALAIHQPLPSITALSFLNEFYRAIAEYDPVEMAVTGARRGLWVADQTPTWGAFRLYQRIAQGRLFAQPPPETEPPRRTFLALRRN